MTPQRFLDHAGWRRNRRAVRVEEDALVIEPRRGQEVRVPWVDVIDLRWQGRGAVMVTTPACVLRFDRHVEGLEELAQAIREARAAVQDAPDGEDVARRLGGAFQATANVGPFVSQSERLRLLGRVYAAFAPGVLLALYLAPRVPWEWTAILLIGLYVGLVRTLLVRGRSPYTLTVDASGVRLRTPERLQWLRWAEIDRWELTVTEDLVLISTRAIELIIPAAPRFGEATEAMRRVLRGAAAVHLDDVPLPPGALSLARMTGQEAADRRALRRVEPEDAP
jgi:hypothetical protein